MEERRQRIKYTNYYDYALLFLTLGISLFGVIMIFSAGYYDASIRKTPYRFVESQLGCIGIGLFVMIFISKIPYQFLLFNITKNIRIVHIVLLVSFILQILVLFVGIEVNGARRWLKLGIQFQPSEISKIAVIIFIAYAINKNRSLVDNFKTLVKASIPSIILFAAIVKENLSSALIIAAITFGMCYVASRNKKMYYIIGIVVVVVGCLYLLFGGGYRSDRVEMWRNVETDPRAFQILQGLYAVASGGLFGKGLGESMQKLGYIPEAYNDMIFSVICEELGVVGAALLIIAFIVLFWRIVVIACNAPDLFGTMLCVGVMIQLAIQVIINVAVVTNSMPSTGIPMPFVSYGGTSIIIIMSEMGMVLGVSRQIRQK